LASGILAGWLAGYVAPGSSGSGMSEVKAVLCSQSSYRIFPVIAEGRLVGMLFQRDLVDRGAQVTNPPLTVADLMTRSPVTAEPDDTLAHLLHLLDRYRLRSLPIVAGRKLVGIVTLRDIIRVEAAYLNGKADPSYSTTPRSHVIYQTRAPEIGKGRLLILLSNPQTAPMLMEMAVAIAKYRHYEIEVLHVIVVPPHKSLVEASVRTVVGAKLLRQARNLGLVWQVPVHTQIRVAHSLSTAVLETIGSEHINLAMMGWKGGKVTPEWIFNRVVDPVIQQANCELVLVKYNGRDRFDRWLVPIAGGPNAKLALELLPALTVLSDRPHVRLCQVFEPTDGSQEMTTLDRTSEILQLTLARTAISKVSLYGNSIPTAVLNYAQQDGSDAIIIGASRAGILQQAIDGNIPAAISQCRDRTVIVVRESRS
jgi:chloride channel protein, CIC family